MPDKFAFMLLFICCFSAPINGSLHAGETNCVTAAEDWLTALEDDGNHAIFRRYVRSTCEFSGSWVKQYADADALHLERTCKDLVLIWSHKQCNYLRDTFDPAAAEPCKAWSREMHRRCLAGDVGWFP